MQLQIIIIQINFIEFNLSNAKVPNVLWLKGFSLILRSSEVTTGSGETRTVRARGSNNMST